MFTLINPVKTADLFGYVVSSLPCPNCKEVISIEIASEKLFLYNNGGKVQDVLSNFDVAIRERFMTGTCGICWDAMFGYDEDEDESYIDSYAEASLFGWDS